MRRSALTCAFALLMVSGSGCSTIRGWFSKEPKQEPIVEQDFAEPYPTTTTYAPAPNYGGGGGRSHTVAKGETLFAIARQYYGDQSKWRTIYDANRNELPDPNRIRVGQRLVIP